MSSLPRKDGALPYISRERTADTLRAAENQHMANPTDKTKFRRDFVCHPAIMIAEMKRRGIFEQIKFAPAGSSIVHTIKPSETRLSHFHLEVDWHSNPEIHRPEQAISSRLVKYGLTRPRTRRFRP